MTRISDEAGRAQMETVARDLWSAITSASERGVSVDIIEIALVATISQWCDSVVSSGQQERWIEWFRSGVVSCLDKVRADRIKASN